MEAVGSKYEDYLRASILKQNSQFFWDRGNGEKVGRKEGSSTKGPWA